MKTSPSYSFMFARFQFFPLRLTLLLAAAPLVALVRLTYRIMIPLIACGLIGHVLLHLWRYQTHRLEATRRRRS